LSYDNATAEAINSLFGAELVRNLGPVTGSMISRSRLPTMSAQDN